MGLASLPRQQDLSWEHCVHCSAPAMNKDHLPPKAFFPESKTGTFERKNLLTVPACSPCDNGRSLDDDYAAALLVKEYGANRKFGALHDSKTASLLHGEWPIWKRLSATQTAARLPNGKRAVTIAPDMSRIRRVLVAIASGYLWRTTGDVARFHQATIRSPTSFYGTNILDPTGAELYRPSSAMPEMRSIHEMLAEITVLQGQNPEVFWVRVCPEPLLVEMCFYERGVFFVFAADEFGSQVET